jgi:hypothetical protein
MRLDPDLRQIGKQKKSRTISARLRGREGDGVNFPKQYHHLTM